MSELLRNAEDRIDELVAEIAALRLESVTTTQEDEMNTWIEKHSVNCIQCNELFDERNSMGSTVNGGDICPDCWEGLLRCLDCGYAFAVADACPVCGSEDHEG